MAKTRVKLEEKTQGLKLSQRALLVSLHISRWGASKYDKEVSEEISVKHDAGINAGRYKKFLLSKEALKEINSIASLATLTHKTLTLPWEDNGPRIITTKGYINYAEIMKNLQGKFDKAVERFVKGYPEYVKEARKTQQLGTMFKVDDYPDVKDLPGKFKIDVEPKQVTDAGDFRVKMSADSAKAIAEDIERRSTERLDNAISDVWARIVEVLEKLIERMHAYDNANPGNKKKGSFNYTIIENIKDLAELLPNLNINNDPKLNEISKSLMKDICNVYSVDDLRKDSKLRSRVRKDAKNILDKVSDYMA